MSIMTPLESIAADAEDTVEVTTHDARRYIATLRRELDQIEERLNAGTTNGHSTPETLRLAEALTARDAALRTLTTIDRHRDQATPAPAPEEPTTGTPKDDVIRATAAEAVELAACNYCKSRPGEPCTSRAGHTLTVPHMDRRTRARSVLLNRRYIAAKYGDAK